MALIAKESGNGGNYAPIEAGTYPARCCGVIDLGLQHVEFQGQKKDQEKVLIMFELPTERIEVDGEDKPRWMSARYTVSLHEKAGLRKTLDAWRGVPMTAEELKGFDLSRLLKAPCMLTIVHKEGSNGNMYANISGVSKMMKGMSVAELESEPILFDMSASNAELIYEKLPEWIRKVIDESPTWKERKANPPAVTEIEDDGELPWDMDDGALPL